MTAHTDTAPVVDYRAIVRRRRWSLIVPSVAGLAAGIALAVFLPREYVASATLAVTSPSVSGGLAPSTPLDQAERIRAVSHELLSDAVVEQVARDERLLDRDAIEDVVTDIRGRTVVSLPAKTLSSNTRFEPDTFIVSYTGRTPELAQRVTNGLTQVFVESHSKMRETRAEVTSEFLARQLAASGEKVAGAETRLREAKTSYQGRLPEQAMANLQSVSELRMRVDGNAVSLRTERERLTAIEQHVEEMRQDAATAASRAIEQQSEDRLSGLERQLAEARLQFTPKHPEIQRLENDLARARAEDAIERQRAAGTPRTESVDPAYRQLLADRESTRLRIRELQAEATRLQDELGQSQGRLNEAPLVEQRLASLSQAYDFEKQQYQKLAEQHQAALLTEDLERRRAGEQFIVLYGAELPGRPSSPNIPLVVAFAVLAGVALGGGLAVLRELLDRAVHDKRTLQQDFDQIVLAEIPHF